MDLNLYLGLRRSPRSRGLDLGSDLALSSLPPSNSSNSEENRAPETAPVVMEPSAPNDPYSPFHATIPEIDAVLVGYGAPNDANLHREYSPCFPAYESYGPSSAQDSERPVLPYSASNAPDVSVEEEIVETDEREGSFRIAFDEGAPWGLISDSYTESGGSHPPYSPQYVSHLACLRDDENFASSPLTPMQVIGPSSSRRDVSSLPQELIQSPEFRIRRLVESQRSRLRQLRSSVSHGNERTNFFQSASPTTTDLMLDIMNSQISLEANGNRKVPPEAVAVQSSEEDEEQKNRNAAYFECNICFDTAKEPVVTSCGHLFCWSCLYQWLHVHSEHKECPVCKGEVTDSNIIPIYGRGKEGSDMASNVEEKMDSGVQIPPRPRGSRLESWQQNLRPISRRFGEGIANSWRRLLTHQIRNRSRFGGHEEHISTELLNGESHALLSTSTTGRSQREGGSTRSLPNVEEIRFPRDSSFVPGSTNAGLAFEYEYDVWQQLYAFAGADRLTPTTIDVGREIRRLGDSYGSAPSSANAPLSDHFPSRRNVGAITTADQASASSTVAVMHGEMSVRDASAGQNRAESSRPYRRRGRSNASGSSDVDVSLHGRKKRTHN
ncbi:hypothetical protein HPP92_025669 [Vanilla planifolia]|uniref:E3 ubiquitin-protein ligase RMA n=1 Tax=Vanilla planifolia TaxID=51239 RepID=A0A835PFT6_VANPL|nr:hypothetical protein HPP92_025669 [Vanilla planifolia]